MMKRREFIFRSAQASILLSPILSIRMAHAQKAQTKRLFCFVICSGYPDEESFFPTGSETDFKLSTILQPLQSVKDQMILIDGIDLKSTGPNPRGNNHLRSIGKVLTAKDVLEVDDENYADSGGISIDQLIARNLGLETLEVAVEDRFRNSIREQPFSLGPRQFKAPLVYPEQAWDKMFESFKPGVGTDKVAEENRLLKLRQKKSILDSIVEDLNRFRRELVGAERLKLDIHEDSLRRAEISVQADLDKRNVSGTPAACSIGSRASNDAFIPTRGKAHFDVMFSALACNRIQIGSMIWGFSGYHWRYEWLPDIEVSSIHDDVHHFPNVQRDKYIRSAQWDWAQLADFVRRLKETPDGSGTLLDNTLVLAIGHFGIHHKMERIPAILFGSAQGQLRTNRYVKLNERQENGRLLTSVAHLMGNNIAGIGDDLACGPLPHIR